MRFCGKIVWCHTSATADTQLRTQYQSQPESEYETLLYGLFATPLNLTNDSGWAGIRFFEASWDVTGMTGWNGRPRRGNEQEKAESGARF
jgi:hypothetical protein